MYNEDFIAEMRANPESWGRQYGRNSIRLTRGHVEIYNRHDALCSIYTFMDGTEKKQFVTKACNEIKRLKGYYVVISFLDDSPQPNSKRKKRVFRNNLVDELF